MTRIKIILTIASLIVLATVIGALINKARAEDGSGVGIGQMDGSAYLSHPEINTQIAMEAYYSPANMWHGTAVASVMVGKTLGVAPKARLYNWNIYATGWDNGAKAYAWFYSLNQSGANIRVVNESFANGGANPISYGELQQIAAYRNQFVVVHAAGNASSSYITQYWQGNAAADFPNLLIVGAVDAAGVMYPWSNRPGNGCFANGTPCNLVPKTSWAMNFFVVDEGVNITVANHPEGLAVASGTSLSAPKVSGKVALVNADAKRKGLSLPSAAVAEIIRVTADDLGVPGVDGVFGWGKVNVDRALAPVGPLTAVVVPGQAAFDRYRRPYITAPVPAVAPSTAAMSAAMMGRKVSSKLHYGPLNLTSRQAMVDDNASLNMVGLEYRKDTVTIGLTAGALHENFTFLGNYHPEPTVTRIAGVELSAPIGQFKVSGFYMRGAARGYPADTYGIGVTHGDSLRVELVKPLSITHATVPVGYGLDGGLQYATLQGERPWAARMSARWEW